jgi:RHS repeat-associated protein
MPHHVTLSPRDGHNPELQQYKFGGKELDEMHGLKWYDFGARYYSGIIPGFMTPDPLAEKFPWQSPYAFCNNNPILYIDPTGKEGVKYIDENGNKTVESNVTVLVQQKKEIPKGATDKQIAKIEKQNARIERNNNARVADVQKRLDQAYNGSKGEGTKNSAGETVKFKFNVKGVATSDTRGGTTSQIRAIAGANSLPTSQKDFGGNKINALSAVVTTRSSGAGLGRSNGIYVTESAIAPSITLAHEIGHTLKLGDNFPNSTGGLMDYPAGGLISSEVDAIWENAYEK